MLASIACDALRQGKRLELRYDGWARVIEVHAVGISTTGTGLIQAYQVRGGSNSNERFGWKNFKVDEALSAHLIDELSEAPRSGYKRNASAFQQMTCQI